MGLTFRNLDVTVDAPVERWGFDGVVTAVDRGELSDWRRIMAAVRADPWGTVARTLELALEAAEDTGVAGALRAALVKVRADREREEREAVAAEIRSHLARSGLSQAEAAARLGTSRSRLNTYVNAKVVPSATFLVRVRSLPSANPSRDRRSGQDHPAGT